MAKAKTIPSLRQHPEHRVIAAARRWVKDPCHNDAADNELYDAVRALDEHEGKSRLTKTVKHGRKTRQ